VLREGVRTVIFGAPNVGKSSLLNRLLGSERAIVSARPGTTRDVIEEIINLRGIPLRLVDTAGVRESDDEIERAGIQRTRQQLERADLVLHVADATLPRDESVSASVPPPRSMGVPSAPDPSHTSPTLLILNKTDLPEHPTWNSVEAIRLSCATGEGFDALAAAIESRVLGGAAQRDWTVAINARHQACLERARGFLDAARRAFDDALSAEFVAEELRAALDAIGEIVGRTDTEDLLGVIFSRFCIGK
jgi:tRNA modification GTPase